LNTLNLTVLIAEIRESAEANEGFRDNWLQASVSYDICMTSGFLSSGILFPYKVRVNDRPWDTAGNLPI